jgi:hypothetical protein
MDKTTFRYIDFDQGTATQDIGALFPGWQEGDERVMVLCPHDDDGALGAGYAILAALAHKAEVTVGILCDGWAGYSTPADAPGIVQRRAAETLNAYQQMGVPPSQVLRFNYPDFSLLNWRGWKLPGGENGEMTQVLPAMRRLKITRLLLPNPYREHIDHEAAYQIGAYNGPQVGDACLAEIGFAPAIRSYAQYAVWADLSPEDALVQGRPSSIRANRAILAPPQVEDYIAQLVTCWDSQRQVISGVMEARRRNRVRSGRALELYYAFNPRPELNFGPYHDRVDQILKP